MEPTFEQYMKAHGQAIDTIDEAEQAQMQAAYDALTASGMLQATYDALTKKPAKASKAKKVVEASADDDTPPVDTASQGIAELKAEARRLGGIRAALDKHPVLMAKAIDENWTVEAATLQAELADLRTARPKVTNVINAGGNDIELTAEMAGAAMCLKHGVGVSNGGKSLLATYGEKVVNQADKIRRMRFSDIMRSLCAQAGIALPYDIGSSDWIKAAFSGSSIGATVLGAVANKALADVIAEPTWLAPQIAGTASHANFHTHTVYSLSINGDLKEIAPTGEIDHMDLSAESYTRQLKTRGALLRVTRQDIINDDMGAFARTAQTMARKSLNTREKALFTAINVTGAGTSHFTAARGNYLSGVALGQAAIAAAVKAFRNLTGADGDPILVEPAIMLVASTNEDAARRLLASGGTIIATGVGSSKVLDASANIYGGRFGGAPLVGPYLENANLTGYSTTAFYLLANPAVLPCFEIAYLNGQTMPTIEYFGLDSDINTLGVSWRVYYDFGVGTAEWRAGVKHAGA